MTTGKTRKRLVIRKKVKKEMTETEMREALTEIEKKLDKEQPFQYAFNWGGFYDSSDPDESVAEAAEDLT